MGDLVFKHNYIIKSLSGDLKALTFRVGDHFVSVRSIIEDDQGELKPDVPTLESAIAFREQSLNMDPAALTNSGMSHYSPSLLHFLDKYPVRELKGRVLGTELRPDWDHLSADGYREYLSCLLSAKKLPVFTVSDRFGKYVLSAVIQRLSLYLIRASGPARDEYINEGLRLCFGEHLLEYRQNVNAVPFEIVYVCHPVVAENTAPIRAAVAGIEVDARLVGDAPKKIPNTGIGKMGRTHNKTSNSLVFADEQEARHYYESLGGAEGLEKIEGAWLYTNEDKTHRVRIAPLKTRAGLLFVVTEDVERQYESGSRPWNHWVKDASHLRLAKRAKVFRELGYTVTGYKTDEIWLSGPPGLRPSFRDGFFSSPDATLFENLGKVKPLSRLDPAKLGRAKFLTTDRFAGLMPVEFACAGDARLIQTRRNMTVRRFTEAEELAKGKHENTLTSYIAKFLRKGGINRFLIQSVFPGGGKSVLARRFVKRYPRIKKAPKDGVDYPTVLIVCPSKFMVEELRRAGWNAETLCRFFGHDVNNQKVIAYSEAQINAFQLVIFEEIYMYNLQQLQSMYRFIHRYPKINVLPNGDPLQLPPIERPMLISAEEQEAYQHANIAAMFPEALSLQINRSMADPEDRKWLAVIHQLLFYPVAGAEPVPYLEINAVLKERGFRGFDEYYDLDTLPVDHPDRILHLAYMNNTIAKVTNMELRRRGRDTVLPEPGDPVTCFKYIKKAGQRPAVSNQSD